MATVSYTIRSHYDSEQHKKPEHDTSPTPADADGTDSWQFDRAFKPPPPPPPRFVPATVTAPDWDSGNAVASSSAVTLDASPTQDVSSWYRSLTSKSRSQTPNMPRPALRSPRQESGPTALLPSDTKPVEKKNKNNWFIMNAIRSDTAPQPTRTSSPTLADIIARDPPPLPNERRFKPPVWLEIGPSNKGFAMLQRSGWSEGEPLGPDVVRQRTTTPHADDMILSGKKREASVKQETLEVNVAGHDDVAELRQVDVIDLTLSDSDEDDLQGSRSAEDKAKLDPPVTAPTDGSQDPHGRTALLTPIATVLKSDRLGIGLKAKTVGPYKASQKRITHNAAAMAAHIKAAEESRRRKQLYGRGRRGFTLQRRKEEADRKGLLAYLNQ
ncbi:hypothetical protein LshimejAT787_0502570 [Lyophyllum shimeji]|uniref:G-patch domain-containing protein n=1 Tax=Lyophyllum shimeji TaxID=47721 RepID=A0A9P3PL96_LYOSH|nr:hypothetical protein LshimejAT787_0502570 [Lyophyllum shimeji]